MADIQDLTIVDASNTARFPENQAPSTVNDGARALEGIVARWHKDTNGSKASTGSANAYVFAADQTLSAYYDGLEICFDANFTNTGAATLNVDAVSADAIVWPDGTALASGDIPSGAKIVVRHDGTNWQLGTVVSPVTILTGLSGIEVIRKTADQTVNNSTTLVNDTHLLAALATNERVYFRAHCRYMSHATADIKFTITVPSGATAAFATTDGTGARESDAAEIRNFDGAGVTTEMAVELFGFVANGANAGNLQFQWAQNTADASDTKVLENSHLMVWRT